MRTKTEAMAVTRAPSTRRCASRRGWSPTLRSSVCRPPAACRRTSSSPTSLISPSSGTKVRRRYNRKGYVSGRARSLVPCTAHLCVVAATPVRGATGAHCHRVHPAVHLPTCTGDCACSCHHMGARRIASAPPCTTHAHGAKGATAAQHSPNCTCVAGPCIKRHAVPVLPCAPRPPCHHTPPTTATRAHGSPGYVPGTEPRRREFLVHRHRLGRVLQVPQPVHAVRVRAAGRRRRGPRA